MNQKLLAEYVLIEAKAKEIEEKKQSLREAILKDLQSNKMEKVESEVFGTFTVCTKVSYKYTPAIKQLAEKLAIAKIKEQDKGVAKPMESNYLLYTPNK